MSNAVSVRRLGSGDQRLARDAFMVMAQVFEESEPVGETYVQELLDRKSFWAFVAYTDSEVVGGLTAHVLPMTRSASAELFIYDVAVRGDWQRKGVGRQLLMAALDDAKRAGLDNVFVPAETADEHALDFYRAIGGDEVTVSMFTFDVAVAETDVP